jgi:hypothetical protein
MLDPITVILPFFVKNTGLSANNLNINSLQYTSDF